MTTREANSGVLPARRAGLRSWKKRMKRWLTPVHFGILRELLIREWP